ncbi:MAG: peptidoglycan/xylan/chitin deacetylase (PgdA/CDA1 family) [Ilumatobacter sp.]|jgi:peptidoglycan/xylan/chitin deacetylase (PgdA/CDA1 family)
MFLGDRLLPTPAGITVLIYHTVGAGNGGAVDVDIEMFDEQLAYLGEHHRVLSLAEAVDELQSGAGSPAGSADGSTDAVVITFDDGTTDFVEHSVPALVKAGLPATLYACTQAINGQQPFPWGAPPATWAGLRDAASTGLISIESHTHTHALLDRLPAADIAEELDRSIELIGEHIGTAPRHFAYPKAVPGSAAAQDAIRERFDSASLARNRVNQHGRTDLQRLWRTPIQRSDDIKRFATKAAGGARIEGEVRNQLARWKYRGATR